ncbi:heavy-metal-associated domain-containing protein [Lacinutrix venerupis]|uniref:Heavy metal transporter n=1 Tax=Lacinutrix venerupis TaxID=1486034 RepID=A0AAC9LP24_9FLAO|nr:heavy metal-associated domain-containing protein [Lacinutrix venerupis]APY01143.1 heavy metal transporter [Lacinutrix venerupis]
MKHTYKVTGMTCGNCKASVEKALNNIEHVTSASVDLEKAEVEVKMSQHISIEKLQEELPEKFSILEIEKQQRNVFSTVANKEEKTDLQKLKPLFIIFAYIIIASILLHYKNWNWSDFMLDFMGLFYIVFSFFKILDLKGFPESFKMYDPLAKVFPAYAKIYPFIEIVLGLMFLMRFQIFTALIVTIIVLGITTIGVIKTLLNKQEIQCACLGTVLKLPMTKATFIENTIMIIMAIIMLYKTYN